MSTWFNKLLIFPPNNGKPNRTSGKRIFLAAFLLFLLGLYISPSFREQVSALLGYTYSYKEYKAFGIRIPKGFEVHGIDVSRYQDRIDWERVANMQVRGKRISFAFIKATEGSWMKDPWFEYNWRNAQKQGIVRGAYHYYLPDISPRAQARHFTKNVRLKSGDLPPVVDVEETRNLSKAQVRKYTKDFLVRLESSFGVKPIVYTNRDFYKIHFANRPAFKPYYFWIAHYHVDVLEMPDDSKWHFWQHSDRGTVNGINNPVDFNVFYGDSLSLQKICVP